MTRASTAGAPLREPSGTELPSAERRLRDVRLRAIRPEDWRRLQRFHRRLSGATIERRFHGAKRELSTPLAHRFSELEHTGNSAVVATTGTRGRIVAVARYFRIDGRSAEMAIVVEDAYQGQGLGRRLMHRLREMALRDGITEFVAEVLPSNVAMFRLLEEMGETHTTYDRGVCEVRVGLAAVASS